jgi:ABC-type Fe3+-citrate transport system substrate-binding protein
MNEKKLEKKHRVGKPDRVANKDWIQIEEEFVIPIGTSKETLQSSMKEADQMDEVLAEMGFTEDAEGQHSKKY